jgi:hypothetical protein
MKKNNSNKNNNLNTIFAVLAIVLIVLTLVNLSIVFIKNSELRKSLTGFATSTGYVNLTVNTNLNVALSPPWGINWSNGSIASGKTSANLTTTYNSSSVINGNWSTTGVQGILITNTGNINITLSINGTKNNTDWFGTTSTGAKNYTWNVTNFLPGSCAPVNSLNSWLYVNHTNIVFCNQFSSIAGKNQVWLDVQLTVPYDLTNPDTLLTDTITVSATAAT